MPVDPNIALQVKTIDFDPVGSAEKAITLSSLARQNQVQSQSFNDDQAMRQALQNNTAVGPDGSPQINRAGVLSDLARTAPTKAMAMQQQFLQLDQAQQDRQFDILNKQTEISKNLAWSIHDQDSWTAARTAAMRYGLPNADKMPEQYDPDLVKHMQYSTLAASEQLAQQQKAKDNQFKAQEVQNKAQELALMRQKQETEIAHYGNDKKMKAMEDYNNAVAGARQEPDASQALKDIQSSKKISGIVSQAPGGDLNKLNNQQTKLAMMEVVKMAGGSVPTEGELESMTPDNAAQKLSSTMQKITNKSWPAKAGEFLKQGIDYANEIGAQGSKNIASRSYEIADRMKPFLGEDQYNLVNQQTASKFGPRENKKSESGGDTQAKIQRLQELRAKAAGGNQ